MTIGVMAGVEHYAIGSIISLAEVVTENVEGNMFLVERAVAQEIVCQLTELVVGKKHSGAV